MSKSTITVAMRIGIGALALLAVAPLQAQQADELLPNLQAFPAEEITMAENFGGVLELRFGARLWNSGAGPFELIAGEIDRGRQNVYQRIYNGDGSYQDHLAGDFVWHQGHDHFHFDEFAQYTLQPEKGGSKRNSVKTSFCLMDTEVVDGQLPGAPNSAQYANCGNFFQGISVGWADVYGPELPGQSIDLTRLKDGRYRLIIDADPRNRLLESNENDNQSCVLLDLDIGNQAMTVIDAGGCDSEPEPPPGGDVTLASISPDSAAVDNAVSVVVTGTGFAEGMGLEFVNGEGPKPGAGDVVVVSSTEMHATVTVKFRGGNKPDNVWDVVVGSAVLRDAFTVLP